jgi:hypothetical protein
MQTCGAGRREMPRIARFCKGEGTKLLSPDPQLGGAANMTTPGATAACSQRPAAPGGRYRPGPDSFRKASARTASARPPVSA